MAISRGPELGDAKRDTQVYDQVRKLEACTKKLSALLSELSSRLTPVLRDSAPGKDAKDAGVHAILVPLASQLQGCVTVFEAEEARIQGLLERLEL